MPALEAHHNIVRGNLRLLTDHLVPNVVYHPDWTATVAFYTALHMVEAAFSFDAAVLHTFSHEERNVALRRPAYNAIWDDYRRLYTSSLLARYLQAPSGSNVSAFCVHMPPGVVRDQLIGRHLVSVRQFTEQTIGREVPGFTFS